MENIFDAPKIKSLCNVPTPIYELKHLSKHLNGPQIFIKRDDMIGPPNENSGNKTRKLQFLAGEALAKNADSLITEGRLQSNHCRQTAAVARKLGLECHIIYGCHRPDELDGNALIVNNMGATIHFSGDTARSKKRKELVKDLKENGKSPYNFCAGGSTSTGALGYIFFFEELLKQQEDLSITFDHLFHCSSSGGTEAGLVCGKAVFNWKGVIHSVVNDPVANGYHHREYAKVLLEEIKSRFHLKIETSNECHDYSHEGYGETTEEDIEAIKIFLEQEGIYIDPVYGAKPARKVIEMIRNNSFNQKDKVLLLHTGGHPTMHHSRYKEIYSNFYSW